MTYEEWLAVEEVSYKLVSPSYIRGVMDACGCYEFAMDLTTESARAFRDEMNSGVGFNFNPDDPVGGYVRSIVESWITKYGSIYPDGETSENGLSYGERIQSAYADILDYALTKSYPNSGGSLLKYNQSQNKYTQIERPFSTEIKLQVTGCEERCPAVVYGIDLESYDEPQNLGCASYGKDKFVFDLSKAKKFPMVEIRFPYIGVEVI